MRYNALELIDQETLVDGVVQSDKTKTGARAHILFRNRLDKPLSVDLSSVFLVTGTNAWVPMTAGAFVLAPHATESKVFESAAQPLGTMRAPYSLQFHSLLSQNVGQYGLLDVAFWPLTVPLSGGIPPASRTRVKSSAYNFNFTDLGR